MKAERSQPVVMVTGAPSMVGDGEGGTGAAWLWALKTGEGLECEVHSGPAAEPGTAWGTPQGLGTKDSPRMGDAPSSPALQSL